MVSKYSKKNTGSVLLSRNKGVKRKLDAPPPPPKALSSKAGRALIRRHHVLQKRLAQALQKGDTEAAQLIQKEIEADGGLEKYQLASIQGQSEKRGGDSSKILLNWIREERKATKNIAADASDGAHASTDEATTSHKKTGTAAPSITSSKLRVLEVGCLSTRNAISRSPLFMVTRIDLNSQEPEIESQDFMERPLPANEEEKFDLISLSLVLNYVPEPAGRGEMLRRTTKFLRERTSLNPEDPLSKMLPSVFLVLPAPCVTNSRHLNEKRLAEIMRTLGYTLVKRKLSAKLIYGLWRLENSSGSKPDPTLGKKVEVNPGVNRNNFAVLLK